MQTLSRFDVQNTTSICWLYANLENESRKATRLQSGNLVATLETINLSASWHRDPEALIHGVDRRIVVPGEPVFFGQLRVGQPHHLRVTAAEARLLPDHAQSRDDLVVASVRAGGADDADGTIIHVVAYSCAASCPERNRVQFRIANPDFNGVA